MALGIVAGFGLYLWAWNDAQRAFQSVRVVADATPLRCSGVEPGHVERVIDTSSTFSMSRIELRRTAQCEIEFHLQNMGTRDVDVDTVIVPSGGVGAAGAVAVRLGDDVQPGPRGNGDAAFELGISLRPGEERTATVAVAFQEGICLEPGGSLLFDDYIRVELSRWVFDGRPGTELVPIAFVGTDDSIDDGCPIAADPEPTP